MLSLSSAPGRCARCSGPCSALDAACRWCGARRLEGTQPRLSTPPRVVTRTATVVRDGRWLVLGVGALIAPVLTLAPLLRYVGWFLASLVHETGHVAMAWLYGCPAFPAIRLDGHAAAIHREQQPVLCVLVAAGLAALVWASRQRPRRLALAVALLVAYVATAFTRAHEALFLLGGHIGELAFAAYAFSRALDGGFTGSTAERFAHAGVASYLVGRTGFLAVGLLTSDAARHGYATNGSFGLENDLLRLCHDHLHTSSLAAGAVLLLAIALGVVGFAVVRACRDEG
jgi:hypothetical protein